MGEATRVVLDSSALLALACGVGDSGRVARALPRATMNAINVAECIAVLSRCDTPSAAAAIVSRLGLSVISCDWETASTAAEIQSSTRHVGLSLAECICLATARRLAVPALTANAAWARLDIGVAIEVLS